MIKSISLFIMKDRILNLLEVMKHTFWDAKETRTVAEKNSYSDAHHKLTKSCHFYVIFYLGTASIFIAIPMLLEKNALIFECYKPLWLSYYNMLLFQIVVGSNHTLFTIIPFDMLIMSLLTLTKIQFSLLNKRMEDLYDCRSDKNERELGMKLKRCLDHHVFLRNYCRMINDSFSRILTPFIAIAVLTMCVEMYKASISQIWTRTICSVLYTILGLVLIVFAYCIPAQDLTDEAYKINDSVYKSGWFKYCTNSTAVVLIMAMGQKEINISAGGFLNIDLNMGVNTIKSMVSYCMFLRTMGSPD